MSELDIFIDATTNCLVERATGRELDTEYRLVQKTITATDAEEMKEAGWNFDWSEPQRQGYEVYELLLEGEDEAQGMIALQHRSEDLFTHVSLAESAPWNIGSKGRYVGVGGHLFAIACKLSWEAGNEGYVQFTAKTNLVEHYRETLGAISIDAQNMYIDSLGSLQLIRRYFKEAA